MSATPPAPIPRATFSDPPRTEQELVAAIKALFPTSDVRVKLAGDTEDCCVSRKSVSEDAWLLICKVADEDSLAHLARDGFVPDGKTPERSRRAKYFLEGLCRLIALDIDMESQLVGVLGHDRRLQQGKSVIVQATDPKLPVPDELLAALVYDVIDDDNNGGDLADLLKNLMKCTHKFPFVVGHFHDLMTSEREDIMRICMKLNRGHKVGGVGESTAFPPRCVEVFHLVLDMVDNAEDASESMQFLYDLLKMANEDGYSTDVKRAVENRAVDRTTQWFKDKLAPQCEMLLRDARSQNKVLERENEKLERENRVLKMRLDDVQEYKDAMEQARMERDQARQQKLARKQGQGSASRRRAQMRRRYRASAQSEVSSSSVLCSVEE